MHVKFNFVDQNDAFAIERIITIRICKRNASCQITDQSKCTLLSIGKQIDGNSQ